jgi:hypothetical protein
VKLLGDGEADASGAANDQNRVTRRIHAAMPPNGLRHRRHAPRRPVDAEVITISLL